jgi:hypothetical protein
MDTLQPKAHRVGCGPVSIRVNLGVRFQGKPRTGVTYPVHDGPRVYSPGYQVGHVAAPEVVESEGRLVVETGTPKSSDHARTRQALYWTGRPPSGWETTTNPSVAVRAGSRRRPTKRSTEGTFVGRERAAKRHCALPAGVHDDPVHPLRNGRPTAVLDDSFYAAGPCCAPDADHVGTWCQANLEIAAPKMRGGDEGTMRAHLDCDVASLVPPRHRTKGEHLSQNRAGSGRPIGLDHSN